MVSLDATHGTNGYNFLLVTIMVKDETQCGVPVGHLICTRESTAVLTVFIKELRKKCGRIVVDYVLTDDASMVIINKNEIMQIN